MQNVNLASPDGRAPLMLLAQGFSPSQSQAPALANILISKGANVNKADATGTTALIYSVKKNFTALLLHLIEKANLNAVDNNGNTALMWAAHDNKWDIAQALLSAGADAYLVNKNNQTARSIAASKGHTSLYNFLSGWMLDHPQKK